MRDWEKRFDELFRYCIEHSAMEHADAEHIGFVLHDDAIKDFIRNLLKEQKRRRRIKRERVV